jgi:methylamine dehydrogenase accessory protein MauD
VNGVLLAARVLLAGVFAVAGVAKFADLAGSRRAVREFGAPDLLAPLLGSLLPAGELAVAVALIARGSAGWGAVGALLLLAVFMVAIGFAMLRGREPDCHCFGQLHSAPAGWSTLLRNGVLAGIAAFVVVAGWNDAGTSGTGWLSRLSAAALVGVGIGVAVVVVQAWFSWQLLRQNGRLLARLDAVEARLGSATGTAPPGLAIGSSAPPFALPSVDSGVVTLEGLLGYGRPVMLVFSDPGCGPCTALLSEISEWQRNHEDRLTVAVISRGSSDAHQAIIAEHGTRQVGLQLDREVAEAYAAHATPSAVLIDPEGRIASGLAAGRDAIVELVEHGLSLPLDASEQRRYPPSAVEDELALALADDQHLHNLKTLGK